MISAILDASALLALLLDEPGANKVIDIIDRAAMSAVNYAEIYTHYARLGVGRDAIFAMLRPLPIEVIAADTKLAIEAGMLRMTTFDAGLSLGDRFCLALARRENLPAWTADKAWEAVADAANVRVHLIR
jgi:ribonuclease VapC